MEEIYEIELYMAQNKITKAELAERTGYSSSQLRRMFKGEMTIKEKAKIKSALNLQ